MYYLLFAILYPLSLLPLWLLYGLSDGCYFLLYRVLGYRKKVVWDNMKQAFPEKSDQEIRNMMRRFYRNFCDQWVEVLKLMSMSKKALNRRFEGNWEIFDHFHQIQKNVCVLLGHQFNWEWGSVATQWNSRQLFAGIYLPLSGKAIDRLMLFIRRRSGAMLISAQEMLPAFKALQHHNHILAFMADQSPASDYVKWFPFMNRPAAFFLAPEKAARRAKNAVVFAAVVKLRRGHYRLELDVMCDDASQVVFGSITEQYVQRLEQELHTRPENWMWTHRRWKKKPPIVK